MKLNLELSITILLFVSVSGAMISGLTSEETRLNIFIKILIQVTHQREVSDKLEHDFGTEHYSSSKNHSSQTSEHQPPKTSFQSEEGMNIANKCAPSVECDVNSKYRTINGACNNKEKKAAFGQSHTAFARLLPADFSDGISEPRKMSNGEPLPSARLLRTLLFKINNCLSHTNTQMFMFWGQAVAHDTTKVDILAPQDETISKGQFCCGDDKADEKIPPEEITHCYNIKVPKNDPFFSQYNVTCLPLLGLKTTNNVGCDIKPIQHLSSVTHFIDASFVYGSDDDLAKQLRSFKGGKLVTQSAAEQTFPQNLEDARKSCNVISPSDVCYLAGDVRVNQNPGIVIITTIFMREHNRLCERLAKMNPSWDDETLYQEARRILIAELQHITYTGFISALLGAEYVKNVGLKTKYIFDATYQPDLPPNTCVEMSGGAFRVFHSMITNDMLSSSQEGCPYKKINLVDIFNNPQSLQGSQFSSYAYGLEFMAAKEPDKEFSSYMVNKFAMQNSTDYGTDMPAIDIQRGRQLGIAPYVKLREACGYPKINSFLDLKGIIRDEDLEKLKWVYPDVGDIDFMVGGLLEIRMTGSLVGPTFQCIMYTQFYNWRHGDRYFYNLKGQNGSFRKDQMKQIFKASVARLLCDNIKGTTKVLKNPFHKLSKRNPLISCSQVPSIDLNFWKAQ